MKIIIDKKSNSPAYAQISNFLEQYIIDSKLPPGASLPSTRRLAEWSGTSVRTAFKAIELLSNQGLCYQLPQKGVFVTGRSNKIKRKRLPFIGVYNNGKLCGSPHDSVNIALLNGIQQACSKTKREVLIFQEISRDIMSHYVHDFLNLDSLIVMQVNDFSKINKLAKLYPMINFVSLNYFYSEFDDSPSNVRGVFNDDYWGAYKMTEYLLNQGHKSIVFLTKNIHDLNYNYRKMGFLEAIKNNNFSLDKFSVLNIGNTDYKYKSQEELLAIQPEATVLFCANDTLANKASLLDGDNFSKNVILVSYDSFIMPKDTKNKSHPAVEIEFERMGQRAAEVAISGKGNKIERLQPKLITTLGKNSKNNLFHQNHN